MSATRSAASRSTSDAVPARLPVVKTAGLHRDRGSIPRSEPAPPRAALAASCAMAGTPGWARLTGRPGPADAQVDDAPSGRLGEADQRPRPLGQVAHLTGASDVNQAEPIAGCGHLPRQAGDDRPPGGRGKARAAIRRHTATIQTIAPFARRNPSPGADGDGAVSQPEVRAPRRAAPGTTHVPGLLAAPAAYLSARTPRRRGGRPLHRPGRGTGRPFVSVPGRRSWGLLPPGARSAVPDPLYGLGLPVPSWLPAVPCADLAATCRGRPAEVVTAANARGGRRGRVQPVSHQYLRGRRRRRPGAGSPTVRAPGPLLQAGELGYSGPSAAR